MEKMAYEVPRQIANANTFFNIANVFIFILFTPLFAKAAIKLVPEKKKKKEVMITPKYLNDAALEVPSSAFDNVRFESARSIELIEEIVSTLRASIQGKQTPPKEKLHTMYQNVRILENANLIYLGKIRQLPLTQKDSLTHQNLMGTNTMIEGIAYTLQTEILDIVTKAVNIEYEASEITRANIREVVDRTLYALALTKKGLKEHDYAAFEEILEMKNPDALKIPEFKNPVYLSIDMDGIDPGFAPGVSHQEPGGLTSRQVIGIIQNLNIRIIGADIVEYNPERDIQDITDALAAKLLKEILGKMMEM